MKGFLLGLFLVDQQEQSGKMVRMVEFMQGKA